MTVAIQGAEEAVAESLPAGDVCRSAWAVFRLRGQFFEREWLNAGSGRGGGAVVLAGDGPVGWMARGNHA